jgi:hypothetical protein
VTDKTALVLGVIAAGLLLCHLFPVLLIGYAIGLVFVVVEKAGGG